jgi:hypothetical protein
VATGDGIMLCLRLSKLSNLVAIEARKRPSHHKHRQAYSSLRSGALYITMLFYLSLLAALALLVMREHPQFEQTMSFHKLTYQRSGLSLPGVSPSKSQGFLSRP